MVYICSPGTNMTGSVENPSYVRTGPLRNGQVGFSVGPCQVRTCSRSSD